MRLSETLRKSPCVGAALKGVSSSAGAGPRALGGARTQSVRGEAVCFQRQLRRRRRRKISQLLQTAVHVSLAPLAGPGATLEAKLPQVLLEVLVVHRPVGLRFTL